MVRTLNWQPIKKEGEEQRLDGMQPTFRADTAQARRSASDQHDLQAPGRRRKRGHQLPGSTAQHEQIAIDVRRAGEFGRRARARGDSVSAGATGLRLALPCRSCRHGGRGRS